MTILRTAVLCITAIALGVLTGSTSAQRANPNSNTERGGIDVKRVAGRKVGSITTRGNMIQLELDAGVMADHNLSTSTSGLFGSHPRMQGFVQRISRCSGTRQPEPRCSQMRSA